MIILLQNEARVITKRGSFFITKRGKGYNKTRQVLQNAAIITKRGSTRASTQHSGAVSGTNKFETRRCLQSPHSP